MIYQLTGCAQGWMSPEPCGFLGMIGHKKAPAAVRQGLMR